MLIGNTWSRNLSVGAAFFAALAAALYFGACEAQTLPPSRTDSSTALRDQEANRRHNMARRRQIREKTAQMQEASIIAASSRPVVQGTVRQRHRQMSTHRDHTAAGRSAAPRSTGPSESITP